MSRAARSAAVVVAVAVAGCGGSSHPDSPAAGPAASRPAPAPARRATDAQVIRGWTSALDAGDFARAAGYFASGALVQQVQTFRLATHAAAVEFNRSLPCRADVTSILRQGRASLASFTLRPGRGGRCRGGGTAQVRFVIRDGRIREWRQLPTPEAPQGTTA